MRTRTGVAAAGAGRVLAMVSFQPWACLAAVTKAGTGRAAPAAVVSVMLICHQSGSLNGWSLMTTSGVSPTKRSNVDAGAGAAGIAYPIASPAKVISPAWTDR